MSSEKQIIGFIGTGVMGKSMAAHLLKANHPVNVWTRTAGKAEPLLQEGAKWMDSIAVLAQQSDVVISIVGFPKDVEEIYLGEHGVIRNAKPGTLLIDMTTSSPALAKKIAEAAAEKSLHALDAPVSGGDKGAREATLSIMVGGDKGIFEKALPVLQIMGKNIVYQGSSGSGQHTKMANQIAGACNMIGVCEAMAYAKSSGLDPYTALKSIESGASGSWTMSNLATKMLDGDFEPGFYVKHFIKDMNIAIESSESMELETPGLKLVRSLYQKLADKGFEDDGTHALFKLWDS
ncbi:NAD(P)-dependent oxidoreductase [Rubellicoccus peritrichatus]|uniref:NAD(P)-dependent oxidoreductase n=1 Tax=Rubellicoccus peritrichatus TaxID=3080537 RepID=A0AAQ3LAD3_9BACT|nr:NAD(P)-dependent oxidoreductase [Puniceicoccus sp. CR14]WOO41771.1 NAD(P)-dependent oxidoreductase [Puniceicoccus sp. CR14]